MRLLPHGLVPVMGLRDLVALRYLQRDGMSLTLDAAPDANQPPFLLALSSWLSLDGPPVETFVVRHRHEGTGFIQARPRLRRPEADLLYIAPAAWSEGSCLLWERLLGRLTGWASESGLLRLYAALPAGSAEEAAFRRSGYLRYATEALLRLDDLPEPALLRLHPGLRPQKGRDVWPLQRLYASITPLRVQQAEGLIHNGWRVPTDDWNGQAWTKSLVLEDKDGLLAHLGLRRGRAAHTFRLVCRPEVDGLQRDLITHALAVIAQWPPRPIYSSVRHYQLRLDAQLEELGFTPIAERALTVRHLVLSVRPALEELVLRLQGAVGAVHSSPLSENGNAADGAATLAIASRSALEWEYDTISDHR